MDFFSNLTENHNSEITQPQQLIHKMLANSNVQVECPTIEEVYSALVMVYDEMMLNDLEAATWWTILENFGFCDADLGFVRSSYCAAFAAKQYLKSNTAVDIRYVESNIDDTFGHIYPVWCSRRANMNVPVEKMNAYFSSIPKFLNKNQNYDSVVDNLLFESCDDVDVNPVDIINNNPIFKTAEEKKREILRHCHSNTSQGHSPSWKSDSTIDSLSQTERQSASSATGDDEWEYIYSGSDSSNHSYHEGSPNSNRNDQVYGHGVSSAMRTTQQQQQQQQNEEGWWHSEQQFAGVPMGDNLEELLMTSLGQSCQSERQVAAATPSSSSPSFGVEADLFSEMAAPSNTDLTSVRGGCAFAATTAHVVDPRLVRDESAVSRVSVDRFNTNASNNLQSWEAESELFYMEEGRRQPQQVQIAMSVASSSNHYHQQQKQQFTSKAVGSYDSGVGLENGVDDTLDFIFASTGSAARKAAAMF